MPMTLLYGDRGPREIEARVDGDNLWIARRDLESAAGWELKPEGVCRGSVCVPIPPAREAEFMQDAGSQFNLAAFARLNGQPVVHDDPNRVWFFGEGADARRSALASLEAPDFELPDLNGKMHRLSDYRGKKVLLSAWASW